MDTQMYENNPFFSKEGLMISNVNLKKMKENSVYIWKILINILDSNGKTDNLSAGYLQQIMSGKLLHTTSKKDNETGEKLKALILALDKEENREKFLKSYFCAALITLRNGADVSNSKETWIHYVPTDSNDNKKGVLHNALISFKDDNRIPVGLDMGKYLDTIIKKDDNDYSLTNISAHEGDLLLQAVEENVRLIKSSAKFKQNFELNDDYNSENE